jgi:magnesium/cobalt transport protein CorA
VTLRATFFDATGEDRELDLAAEPPPKLGDRQLLWIDLDERSAEDLHRVAQAVGLEEVALERLAVEERTGPILRLEGRVALTLIAVDPDDAAVGRHVLDLVIGRNHIITVHQGPLHAIDAFRDDVEREPELGRLDAVGFTAGLLDALFASYFRQIEAIEGRIDELDLLAVRNPRDEPFLDAVVEVRRRIARLRRALAPNREALLPLSRPDFELHEELGVIWPGVAQRLERAIDGVENARELLVGSFDLYLGRASQRTNDVMKTLTIISSIALPAIVLAGVMGMNFKLPFFDENANFYVVIGAMVALSVAILGYARWRTWI